MHTFRALLFLSLFSVLAGCVVYEPVPVQSPQSRYDQSWNAVTGAMADQGVSVTTQDRGAGVIRGTRGSASVQASVRTLANGSVEVRITSSDSNLANRISESYDRRMGR